MTDQQQSAVFSRANRSEVGERVGFAAEVFERYGDEIRAIIHFNVKDKSEVDDFFQELFISIVRKPIPPETRDIQAYLYRAVANDVIDSARQTENHRDHMQQYAYCRKNDSKQEDPQEIAIEMEGTKKMFHLIESRLSKREAQVVLQRYGHSFNTKDTAERMDVDKRIVSRYLSIALKKMRQLISKDEGEIG